MSHIGKSIESGVRTLAALPESLCLVPSTHTGPLTTAQLKQNLSEGAGNWDKGSVEDDWQLTGAAFLPVGDEKVELGTSEMT